jgi:hypothetical protein
MRRYFHPIFIPVRTYVAPIAKKLVSARADEDNWKRSA